MVANASLNNPVKRVLPTLALAKTGQALIELILAIALSALLLATLAAGFIAAREAFARSGKNLEASLLLQREIEAIRSIKETDWNAIATAGTYHIEQSGNSWTAVSGSIIENGFTHSFAVEDICRADTTSAPIDCGDPQAVVDPSTKEVTAEVSWTFLGTRGISSTFYLSRYFTNTTWVQTTRADFDAGAFDNTRSTNKRGGTVELISSGGSSNFTDGYDNSGDYTFDSGKIEVVGGFAQLKAQGSIVSGSTTNSGFDTSTSNWTFAPWRQSISQTGNYRSTGGNPGGYAEINLPAAKRKRSGGYWYQAFTTTVDNPIATLTFDWRVTGYDPTPDSFRLYAFVDTHAGSPDSTQNVWDSGEITVTTSWSSTVTVDVSSKVTDPGTYYLKVAVFVDYPNQTRGPYIVGYDNVLLNWSGTIGSYPTDNPSIDRNTSFTAASISSWNSFTQVAQTNGGSIRYQLSDDDGATWKYFDGSSWVTAISSTDFNDAATVNTNIGSFPTINNKINIKAFLISDGSQFVQLDQIVIGYTGTNTGEFTSSSFDAGAVVSFNRIVWTENNTLNTTTQFQIATNIDNSTWNYIGPDGTANTFFTGGSGVIPLASVSGRYIRYKILFTSANSDSPNVEDVTINYSL